SIWYVVLVAPSRDRTWHFALLVCAYRGYFTARLRPRGLRRWYFALRQRGGAPVVPGLDRCCAVPCLQRCAYHGDRFLEQGGKVSARYVCCRPGGNRRRAHSHGLLCNWAAVWTSSCLVFPSTDRKQINRITIRSIVEENIY